MPGWIQQAIIALVAFVGGKTINAISSQMAEARELRRAVDKLTVGVGVASDELKGIKGEIHTQISGLKSEIHERVGGLREEMRSNAVDQQNQFDRIQNQIESVNHRVDEMAGYVAQPRPRAATMRLDMERGCYEPPGSRGGSRPPEPPTSGRP